MTADAIAAELVKVCAERAKLKAEIAELKEELRMARRKSRRERRLRNEAIGRAQVSEWEIGRECD